MHQDTDINHRSVNVLLTTSTCGFMNGKILWPA